MAEIGDTGFFVEGPADSEGNRGYAAAVIEGAVVEDTVGEPYIQVVAPPDYPWTRIGLPQRWVRTEGPARMITREERQTLCTQAASAALPKVVE